MGLEGTKPCSFELVLGITLQMNLESGQVIFAQSTSIVDRKAND